MTFLILSSFTFATETTTECPMMREMNRRNNPKENLDSKKSKKIKANSAAISV